MNHQKIGNKKIKITFAQKRPERKGPKHGENRAERKPFVPLQGPTILKETELYISNLEDSVDNAELINRFKQFGNIREARVVRDKSDKSKGFAFLCFDTHDEADRAMSKMNGQLIGLKAIAISFVEVKPGQKGQNPTEADKKYKKDKLFVKNLEETVTDEELKSIFIQFGNLIDAFVMRYEDTGKSKGIGFIQYFSYKAAEKAIIEMNGRMIKEKTAFVSLAEFIPGKTKAIKPKAHQPLPIKKDTVYVANLPKGTPANTVKSLFSRFGNIVDVHTVAAQRLAFIQFVLAKDAQQAVTLMNGHVLNSKPIKVTLATHKPGPSHDPFYMPKKPSNDPFFTPSSRKNKKGDFLEG